MKIVPESFAELSGKFPIFREVIAMTINEKDLVSVEEVFNYFKIPWDRYRLIPRPQLVGLVNEYYKLHGYN